MIDVGRCVFLGYCDDRINNIIGVNTQYVRVLVIKISHLYSMKIRLAAPGNFTKEFISGVTHLPAIESPGVVAFSNLFKGSLYRIHRYEVL